MKFEETLSKLTNEAKAKLEGCKSIEDIIQVFDENGLTVSKSDIESAANKSSAELSDDDLATVSGGSFAGDVFGYLFKELLNVAKDKLTNNDEKGNNK